MSPSRRQPGRNNRGRKGRPAKPTDMWRPVPATPPPERITRCENPTALIESLGPPPLRAETATAEHYLAAVIDRASTLASALAASADLLAPTDEG